MTRRPRIGVLTAQDARDPVPVSGTPYHMARALERHAGDVVYLGPVPSLVRFVGRARSALSRRLLGRQYDYLHSRMLAREYAWRFRRRLSGIDVIFAPFGSTQIALLDTDIPIVYASDTTFALMCGYYPAYTSLTTQNTRAGNAIERSALSRASIFTTPSRWAAQSAEVDYDVPPDRIRIVPYGANLDAPTPAALALAKQAMRGDERCRLLFIGVDWERKGGRIAYDTLQAVRRAGVDAELVIVGCTPPPELDQEHLRVIPRLDKRSQEDRMQLHELLLRASFHLFPTRSDCFGIAICEASAHGTPSLASDTGGVAAALSHGVNGELLPYDAGGDAFAGRVLSLRADRARYESLMHSSRALYEQRLNWDHWGRCIADVVADLV